MSKVNHGQVFEKGNVITQRKLELNSKNYPRLKVMAEKAHFEYPMLHELEKSPSQEEVRKRLDQIVEHTTDGGSPWANYTASQFLICLLYREGKPVSENLILKRIRENDVFMPYPRIASLVTSLIVEYAIRHVSGKGLALSEDMKALIEEVKPTK